MEIRFKKLVPEAKLPTQGKPGDAAFDLYCVEDFKLHAGETRAVTTGLQLADFPPTLSGEGSSIFLQIEGRSGLALKGVFPLGGIIDATYRGEIKVILHNGNLPPNLFGPAATTLWPFVNPGHIEFKAGDRIAQLLVRKIVTNDWLHKVNMVEATEITETTRGSAGFGSTGA